MKYVKRLFFVQMVQAIALLSLAFAGSAASFQGVEKLQLHGFITQGYFLTSDNAVLGSSDSDHGSLDFTEAGLNAGYEQSKNLSFALQGLYRQMGSVDDELRIDYGLIDWTVSSWGGGEWGVRVGRVKNPMGLYNDTRDVAFTRPSLFLPQGIYYDRSRNLLHSSDGGQLYLNVQTGLGFFQFQGNVGRAENDNKELKIAIFGFDTLGELVSKKANYWGRVKFESNSGALELALSYADVVLDYKPGSGDPFAAGTTRYRPAVLSAQYNWSAFSLTAEYIRQRNAFTHLGVFPDTRPTTESYYLQGEYRFNSQIRGLVRYDAHYLNKDDRNGKQSALNTGRPSHQAFAEDWMVGARWNPNSSWQFQAEYHRVNGTSWLSGQANPDPSQLKQHWDLLTLAASYRF